MEGALFANGLANWRVSSWAPEGYAALTACPERDGRVRVAEAGRDDVDRNAGQQQGRGVDVPQVVQPGVRKRVPGRGPSSGLSCGLGSPAWSGMQEEEHHSTVTDRYGGNMMLR